MIARFRIPTLTAALLLSVSHALAATSAPSPNASARIDGFIESALKTAGKEPMPAASSEVFVRRIYLDIAGRTPTLVETEAFLAEDSPSSRTRIRTDPRRKKAGPERNEPLNGYGSTSSSSVDGHIRPRGSQGRRHLHRRL
jgi:hypothetical protein